MGKFQKRKVFDKISSHKGTSDKVNAPLQQLKIPPIQSNQLLKWNTHHLLLKASTRATRWRVGVKSKKLGQLNKILNQRSLLTSSSRHFNQKVRWENRKPILFHEKINSQASLKWIPNK